MTVGKLKQLLSKYDDADDVCVYYDQRLVLNNVEIMNREIILEVDNVDRSSLSSYGGEEEQTFVIIETRGEVRVRRSDKSSKTMEEVFPNCPKCGGKIDFVRFGREGINGFGYGCDRDGILATVLADDSQHARRLLDWLMEHPEQLEDREDKH